MKGVAPTSNCFLKVDECFHLQNVEKESEACKIYFQRQTRPPKTLLELLASLQPVSAAFTDIYAATCIAGYQCQVAPQKEAAASVF